MHRGRRAQQGLSVLEFVVVTVVIAILVTVLLDRAVALAVAAERADMEYVLGTLRNALARELAMRALTGEGTDPRGLEGVNPVRMLERLQGAPPNYLGELSPARPEDVEPGHWYFDPRQGVLVYRARNEAYFRSSYGKAARFAVRVQGQSAGPDWPALVSLDAYAWVEPE